MSDDVTPRPALGGPEPRRGAGTAARLVAGAAKVALVGAVGAGVVLAAERLPEVSLASPPSSTASEQGAEPPAAATSYCPGAPLSGTEGVEDVTVRSAFTAVQPDGDTLEALVPGIAADGSLRIEELGEPEPLASKAGPMVEVDGQTGDKAIRVGGTDRGAVALTGAQEWFTSSDTVRGIGSLSCAAPTTDAWLIAGGNAPGRQERLLLTNPGANPVEVDITVLGQKGPVTSDNAQPTTVPSGGRTSVLIDAVGGVDTTPVVRVESRGGLVASALTDVWTDGLVPAGVDSVGASADPAESLMLPTGSSLAGSTVRVAVPGERDGVVRLRAVTSSGTTTLTSTVTTVPAGSVRDIRLPSSLTDARAIEVVADVPVVAAAEVTRRTTPGAPRDFAWASAAPGIGRLAGAAFTNGLPKGDLTTQRTLTLTAQAEDARVEVITRTPSGVDTVTRELTAGTAGSWALPEGVQGVWVRPVSGEGVVRGAVLTTVGTQDSASLVTSRVLRPLRLTDRDVPVHRAP
ncbi:DUF5719 family protein [Janibacter sp. G1551]|uniref:DUF5719 family protein n=1 Tax=Janibacter sp. G1551 TaxID=3420440 RepID=UPI003CFE95E8